MSADFRLKATAYLLKDFFKFHNKQEFEVFCFAVTRDSEAQLKKGKRNSCSAESRRYNSFRAELQLDWRQEIADGVEHFMCVLSSSAISCCCVRFTFFQAEMCQISQVQIE